MTELIVFVPGEPRGKGRPRSRPLRTKAGHTITHVYTDGKTAAYENLVAVAANSKIPPERPRPVFNAVPVSVYITAYLRRANGRRRSEIVPTKKPDTNNITAAVLDGLTQAGIWTDDSYVVELGARKLWATPDQEPGVRVRIRTWQPQA